MAHTLAVSLTIAMLLHLLPACNGFNLSPKPSYTFRQPSLKTPKTQTRGSQFGYSVNLRKNGVLVGAPRAESDVESQRTVNETGAVYRCSFAPTVSNCSPLHFDNQGNFDSKIEAIKSILFKEKDYQMLGATMDGLGDESDWFVACAPKQKSNIFLHGICYLTKNTVPLLDLGKVHKIKSIGKQDQQLFNNSKVGYQHAFGQQGFSVHVTDDGKEILMGAPGVWLWSGTVIRYRQLTHMPTAPLKNVYWEFSPTTGVTHEAVVPNPKDIGMQDDSYLGYSVSSGRFVRNGELLYVAGAPRSANLRGEVIIFSYASDDKATFMNVQRTLQGQQMGEYFGYSLLTEDFNGDGLPDLAVGAPLHSRSMDYNHGAVYVFGNQAILKFSLRATLSSSFELGGMFGITLAKIGDCNRDGYNDIAIGAPFEGSGVVYIYHGSRSGLRAEPSQRLEPEAGPEAMFGYAISRGIDIDGNGYNDLAIGAPNREAVYVYRTYPIVEIEATLNSTVEKLPMEGGDVEMIVCWTAQFPAQIPFNVTLRYVTDVDKLNARAYVSGRPQSDEVTLVGRRTECFQFLVVVNASHTTLHEPILIDVQFSLAKRATPPQDGRFCEQCAVLDPTLPASVQETIRFTTGCSSEPCQSDLKIVALHWSDIQPPYVLGSTSNATLEVEINNTGENAFLSHVNITVPSSLRPLMKSAKDCNMLPNASDSHVSVLCFLNDRFPIRKDEICKLRLEFDMTRLEGDNLTVRVIAHTSSNEMTPEDNEMESILALQELSAMYIEGKPNMELIYLQKGTLNITHRVDVENDGPSPMRDLILYINVPLTYNATADGSTKQCHIIDIGSVRATAAYNGTELKIDQIPSNRLGTFLIAKDNTSTRNGQKITGQDVSNGTNLRNTPTDLTKTRRKRSNFEVQTTSQELDRTVFVNCTQDPSEIECLQLQIWLDTLPPKQKPLQVLLQYRLDLDAIGECLDMHQDEFVLQITSALVKPSDHARNTYTVTSKNSALLVTRTPQLNTTDWKIIILSSIIGIALLFAISYGLYRFGFFKRERMQLLAQQDSVDVCYEESENEEEESDYAESNE